MRDRKIDEKKLAELNSRIESAQEERTKLLDEIMFEEAKFKVGDEIWDLKEKRKLGVVTGVYRHHRGDPQFDNKYPSHPYYEFTKDGSIYDNTSRQYKVWGTREEALQG